MTISFPGESAKYRAARDPLLEQEVELRPATEALAVARRALPPGGAIDALWNLFDFTPKGRGTDWDPELRYHVAQSDTETGS